MLQVKHRRTYEVLGEFPKHLYQDAIAFARNNKAYVQEVGT